MRQASLLVLIFLLLSSFSIFAQTLDNTFSGDGKANLKLDSVGNGKALAIQPADQKIIVAGAATDTFRAKHFALSRFLPNGTMDSSFGVAGTTILPLPAGIQTTSGVNAIALQPDGKIVVTGSFYLPGYPGIVAGVVRLTKDGLPDPGFGTGGVLELTTLYIGYAIAVQPDGNILAGGESSNGQMGICRVLGSNGSLDAGFGSGGTVYPDAAGSFISTLVILSNGQILAAGSAVDGWHALIFRLNKNGSLDPGFGIGGIAAVTVNGNDFLQVNAMTIVSQDFIDLAGSYLSDNNVDKQKFLVIQLRGDGTLDPAFAGNGKLAVSFTGFATCAASGIAQDYNGRIIVAGTAVKSNGVTAFALCRLTAQGALDYSWGTDGEITTSWSGVSSNAAGLALQADKKIVAAGTEGNDFAVTRYLDAIVLPPPPVVDAVDSSVLMAQPASIGMAGIRIFPNPASSLLRVQGLDPGTVTLLQVEDALGRTVLTARVDSQNSYTLDIHQLGAGSYFLKMTTNAKQQTLAFVKTR